MKRSIQKLMRFCVALLTVGAMAGAAELPMAPGAFSGCEVVDYKEEGNSSATSGGVRLLATSPDDVVKTEKWIVKSPSASKVRYVVKQLLLASGQVELCSYTPNRVLATLNAGENETAFRAAMAAKGLTVKYELMKDSKGNSVFVVEAEDTENDVVETMTASIQSTGYCGEKIYRNTIYSICATPNDTYWSQQWNMVKIGAPEAWDATADASSVTVAVLDTGINYNHSDLNENLWTNPGEFSKGSNGVDDDGNGIVDDLYGMQCIGGNISGNPIDDVYHGSHCAGIIGAVGNNMFGVAGIAWSAKIMALKFCDASGNGSLEDVIRCLNYADEKGARIINCSWIVEGQWDDLLAERIKSLGNKGVIFVCAAGNANKGKVAVDLDNDGPPTYPACFTCSNIISVAATDSNDELASFSFWGERSVDIAAPGVNIYSTELGGMGIKLDSGTSMATPHVVGALALLMAYYPSESPYALVQKLYDCAEPIPSLKGKVKTGKRLSLKGLFGLRAPTGAEVTASLGTSSEAVIIYWNAVAGATHYRVYRAESENGEKTLLRDWHVGLTFNDTTAVPEQRYYYFIQAASSDAGASASPFSPGVVGYRASAPTTVNVTFNAAGGTPATSTADFTIGEKYGELPTPTYTGKIFLGWHTGLTDGSRIDATCIVRKDVTSLFAHWIGNNEPRLENLFAIQRYPWNGYVDVSFTLAGIENNYVADVALRAINDNGTSTPLNSWIGNAPTNLPNGAHKFVWNSSSDVGSTLNTNIALAATLATRLAVVKSTITLDKQGGTGGTSSVTATNGLAMPPITIPSRTGYTFGGYYTQTGGSGTQYYTSTGTSARTWDKTTATTLYAKWTANTYTIRFNANGGSGTMSDLAMTYDVAKNLTTSSFTKSGNKFTGWATSAGGTVVYAPNASVQNLTSTNGAIVTLYAVWQPQVSTLADAVDNATLTITTGGGANWTVDATSAYTGTASAKSGAIGDGQSSWMQTTITGPGTFSFRWKVSSEDSYDTFTWTLDGAEQGEISGNTSWIEVTKELTAGTHTIRWIYTKDESGSEGSDAAWVDKVVTPLLPPANVTASDGTSTANVKITWTATEGASSYAVWRSETNSSSAATKLGTVAATSYTDTTALPGKIYYYFVTATDGTRTSLFGTSNSGYRALTAPSNVVASDNTLSLGVRITWNAIEGADGYAIYRGTSTSSGTATQIGTSMGTAYIDGEVASATTAYYFVKAQCGTVSSTFSAYDKGTRKSGEPLYIAIDVASGTISELSSVPSGGWTDEYKTTKLVLRRIANGSFTMGSPAGEVGRNSNEDQHQVTLSKPFYIGVFEVTQKQYELVMGSNPSSYKGDMRPVEYVSYNTIRGTSLGAQWPTTNTVDATSFMGKIRAKTGLTFDLPTEAQWEYACRAGTTTALNSGKNLTSTSSDSNMDEVGRYGYNNGYYGGTKDGKGGYADYHTTVGSYKPNAWGLYDMHGNVWEWCLDWYTSSLGTSSVTNPKGASSGSHRVYRGGCWNVYAQRCRSADRRYYVPSSTSYLIGFRLSMTLP